MYISLAACFTPYHSQLFTYLLWFTYFMCNQIVWHLVWISVCFAACMHVCMSACADICAFSVLSDSCTHFTSLYPVCNASLDKCCHFLQTFSSVFLLLPDEPFSCGLLQVVYNHCYNVVVIIIVIISICCSCACSYFYYICLVLIVLCLLLLFSILFT